MELDPEQAVAAHDRGAVAPVVDGPAHDVVHRQGGVAVHEVEVVAVRDVAEPGVVSGPAHGVPADLRHPRHAAEPGDRAAVEAEPRLAGVLLAAVEQELHADADAEDRHTALACVPQRRREAPAVELARAMAEVPDPRKDDRRRVAERDGLVDQVRACADRGERLAHAREVADAVVDDRDHPAPTRPLLEGAWPLRLASRRDAASMTRPSAFIVASRRWWGFPPRTCVTCSVSRPVWASDSRKCGMSAVSKLPTMRSDGTRSYANAGRPPRSMATFTRHSSIGSVIDAKRVMPARSPSASSSARPRTSPRSSTVWCWSTARSPDAFTVRSMRPCTAMSSSM